MHGDEEKQASDVIERVGKHSDDEFAMLDGGAFVHELTQLRAAAD